MKALPAFLSLMVMFQFACAEKSELNKNSGINLADEERSAQELLDSGIKFDPMALSDGVTGEGGTSTGHSYRSSDGVEIHTDVGNYKKVENADRCFEKKSKELEEILKREVIPNGDKGKSGERLVGFTREPRFLIANIQGNLCKGYYSSSLRHLLAFEKWRDNK